MPHGLHGLKSGGITSRVNYGPASKGKYNQGIVISIGFFFAT